MASNFQQHSYDAIVVGSGPNGFGAAIRLQQAGLSTLLVEAKPTIGGGMRTEELTLPGYRHDRCSAIHPMGMGSPFFQSLPLDEYGLEWIQPDLPLAHPVDGGTAARLEQSLEATVAAFGKDGSMYRKLIGPIVDRWEDLVPNILAPPLGIPKNPIAFSLFGLKGLVPARELAHWAFSDKANRALFAGLAAHSMLRLTQPLSSAIGLVLGSIAHRFGWPLPKGGSQSIADALAGYYQAIGGEIVTDFMVTDVRDLPASRAVIFDLNPKQLLHMGGLAFPQRYQKQVERYRMGMGVFKVDYALDGPVPFEAEACRRAGTVHLGGSLNEIARSEEEIWQGRHPERPYVLMAQQSLFDTTRAPEGKHTLWAYCHVPNGSQEDMTDRIERQIERFAPGFRDRVLARHTMFTADMEAYNPNYLGGDINGGVQDMLQTFARPTLSLSPYKTPLKGVYVCSSSTPPGGGVHGMCGYHAAAQVLKDWNKAGWSFA
ncbi:Phytoene dehydrogenase-related protein [Catalinimonas alkaloidigena]|uniref:Phytoene dehydrogenase-related protein n=1 Tax=Catalinimonas alkaloidigena TaxID=1075417 RepID=A0A1G9F9Q7_9BACT|nr:NAD(P)/FAD-dependent oxidoreductase [Catalinimonas alkaloidigena]SDK85058.1 Phytoene dehydrogenase-related protein [Catalinimonas alkaloidigena]